MSGNNHVRNSKNSLIDKSNNCNIYGSEDCLIKQSNNCSIVYCKNCSLIKCTNIVIRGKQNKRYNTLVNNLDYHTDEPKLPIVIDNFNRATVRIDNNRMMINGHIYEIPDGSTISLDHTRIVVDNQNKELRNCCLM